MTDNSKCYLVDEYSDSCWIDDDLTMSFDHNEILEIYYNTYDNVSHCYHGQLMSILQITYEVDVK